MQYDLVIIGGGAAGLMSAVLAARRGLKVLLLEHQNRCGKKLAITGKGRCNVTNNSDIDNILKNIPVNPRFMYSALSNFNAQDIMSFFESLGVKLKTERGNRVFPESDNADEIVEALINELKAKYVNIKYERAVSLITENDKITGVKTDKNTYLCDDVLIATGGKSYPATGSTGDGYKLAADVGHTVTKLVPSLVPIVTNENYASEMMGLSLKNVTLSLFDNTKNKPVYKEIGEMLFTHFGVSGPLVLSASSHIRKMQPDRYRFEIDLKPGLLDNQLDKRLLRDFSENPNKDFENVLHKLLPAKMIPVIISLSDIKKDTKVNQITKEQRADFIKLVKAFPFTIKGFRGIEEAIITSGGIKVSEINPKTMESKLIKGLYFAGEVIDVDAYTGGYNLTIAFSTAYCAANSVKEG